MTASEMEKLAVTTLAGVGTERAAMLATEVQRGINRPVEEWDQNSDYVRHLKATAAWLNSRPCTTPGDPDDVDCNDAACPQHGEQLCGHGLVVGTCKIPLCQPEEAYSE